MKKALGSVGLLFLLAQPLGAFAATSTWQRPSTRSIHAQAEQSTALNPNMVTINQTTLDRTFANTAYGVKIEYPSSWTRQDILQHIDPLTLVVMFLSPTQTENIRQNINLVVEDLPTEMTLPQYTQEGINMEKGYLGDYTLLWSQDETLAGVYPAHAVVFSASPNGVPMMFEQVWLLRGKSALVWTFADAADVFINHLATFKAMLNTLTVQ